MKKYLIVIRWCVGISLIIFLFFKIDFQQIKEISSNMNFFTAGLGVLIIILITVIIPVRFIILLGKDRDLFKYKYLVKISFIGVFFNQFLPSSIGGDISRFYYTSEYVSKKKIFNILLIERLTGFTALILIGIIFSVIAEKNLLSSYLLSVYLIILAAVAAIYLFVILFFKKLNITFLGRLIHNLGTNFYEMIKDYKLILMVIAIGMILRSIWFFAFYLIGVSFFKELTLLYIFIVLPAVEVLRMFPVSISGIGIREVSMAYLLEKFNIDYSVAVVIAFLCYSAVQFNGIIGGIIYTILKTDRK